MVSHTRKADATSDGVSFRLGRTLTHEKLSSWGVTHQLILCFNWDFTKYGIDREVTEGPHTNL
jgi:hypothetical protein